LGGLGVREAQFGQSIPGTCDKLARGASAVAVVLGRSYPSEQLGRAVADHLWLISHIAVAASRMSPSSTEQCGSAGVQPHQHAFSPITRARGRSYRALLVFALASTAAAAETVTEKTGINSALGVAPKTEDFVTEAAVSDMTEIAAARVALEKGDADEKQFADQRVKDHTQTSTD